MKQFVEDYRITRDTRVLLPGLDIAYNTIALEKWNVFHIKKPIMKLMNQSCLTYGASYEGRKKSVVYMTGYKNKVPIPMSNKYNLYMFPTHGTEDKDCAWIMLHHNPKVEGIAKDKSMLVYDDGMTIPIEVSPYTLEKQIKRTEDCVRAYKDWGQ